MEKSEQINELAAALCLAQSEFKEAAKTKTNPHLKSKYADLGSVWDACKPALTKHGLSIVQVFLPSEQGFIALETVLIHKSGQFISGILTMPMGSKMDPQSFGAASTYGRRYGLSALLGICADDDDDGHSASQAPRQQFRPVAPPSDTRQGAAVQAYAPREPEQREEDPLITATRSFREHALSMGYPGDMTATELGQLIKQTLQITGRPTPAQVERAKSMLMPFKGLVVA